jgi:hypothetical protein
MYDNFLSMIFILIFTLKDYIFNYLIYLFFAIKQVSDWFSDQNFKIGH